MTIARRVAQLTTICWLAWAACGDTPDGEIVLEGMTLEVPTATLPAGTRAQLAAIGTYSDGSTQDLTAQVVWLSGDQTRATMSATGELHALAEGPATIAALFNSLSATTTIEVTAAELVTIEVDVGAGAVTQGDFRQLAATGRYTDDSEQDLTASVTWSSSDAAVATIDATGTARTEAVGTTTVTATLGPISGSATLEVIEGTTVRISFDGAGAGEVAVAPASDPEVPFRVCTEPCAVSVTPGTALTITTATASRTRALSGACVSTGLTCTFTPTPGINDLTATFLPDPGETWTRFFEVNEPITSARVDGSGNLVLGSATHLRKLANDGTTLWTIAMPAHEVRTGPGDTIVVRSGGVLKKLSPAGVEIWSSTGAGAPHAEWGAFLRGIAVGPSGEVAAAGVRKWNADGTSAWSAAVSSVEPYGIDIGADGTVWAAVDDEEFVRTRVTRFAADGTPGSPLLTPSSQYHGTIAIDGTGHIVTVSTGFSDLIIDRRTPANTPVFSVNDESVTFASYVDVGVAITPTDDIVVVIPASESSTPRGFYLRRYSSTGAVEATITRLPAYGGTYDHGVEVLDITSDGAGGHVLVGHFDATERRRGWVQHFAP